MKRAKKGGKVTVLAGGLDFPTQLFVDARAVYVLTSLGAAGVTRIPKKGGSLTLIVTQPADTFAVGPARVFWSTGASGGVLNATPLEGGDAKIVARVPLAFSLAATADDGVYFVSKDRLMVAAKAEESKALADSAEEVVVDGSDVYYSDAIHLYWLPR